MAHDVPAGIEFLVVVGELNDLDSLFLDMAKYLVGKPYPKVREEVLQTIIHPVAWLIKGISTSMDAQVMTQEDIKLHLHSPGQG